MRTTCEKTQRNRATGVCRICFVCGGFKAKTWRDHYELFLLQNFLNESIALSLYTESYPLYTEYVTSDLTTHLDQAIASERGQLIASGEEEEEEEESPLWSVHERLNEM